MKNSKIFMVLMASTFIVTCEVKGMNDDVRGMPRGIPVQRQQNANNQQNYQFEIIGDITKPDNRPHEARFRVTGQNGINPDIRTISLDQLEHIRFEPPALAAAVNALRYSDPLPALGALGTTKERVRATFQYGGRQRAIEFIRPRDYPLHASWVFEEDRDHAQTIATLKLDVLTDDRQRVTAYNRPDPIAHELLRTDPEVLGRRFFDGDSIYQARTRLQHYRDPRTNAQYTKVVAQREADIPSHQGKTVVYVEPFSLGNAVSGLRDAYRGDYDFVQDLTDVQALKMAGREAGRLIYSDGANNYYDPEVTRELWRKDQTDVGFFIASHRNTRKLKFTDNARIPNGTLPQGLYHLRLVEDAADKSIERWRKLGEDPAEVAVETPLGVASIPGIGLTAPRQAFVQAAADQQAQEVAALQTAVQEIQRKTQEARAVQGNGTNSVIILGPSGSGKTTFIHGVAGVQLQAIAPAAAQMAGDNKDGDERPDEEDNARLILNPAQSLPGFHVGHGERAGTTLPASWHDGANTFFWDSPGFEDPEGATQDIINAFSIRELFTAPSRIKILLSFPDYFLDKENRVPGKKFLLLLKELTQKFTDDDQLKRSLFILIRKKEGGFPIRKFREIEASNPRIFTDNPRVKTIFKYILDTRADRALVFPTPQGLGAYNFPRAAVMAKLNAVPYVQSPAFQVDVDANSQLLIGRLATRVNDSLTDFIKTEGCQRVVHFCQKHINAFSGAVADLRTWLGGVVQRLRSLQNNQVTKDSFVQILEGIQGLSDVMPIKVIKDGISQLAFLKGIKNDVRYETAAWANAFGGVIAQIEALMAAPTTAYDANSRVLTVKGPLLGTSDVVTAMAVNANANALARVDVQSMNTLLVDADITCQGAFVSFMAPQLRIVGQRTINVSGVAGVAGAGGGNGAAGTANAAGGDGGNGAPGGPGGNGGNFYAKAAVYAGLANLTINTSGGAGGSGGTGGNGGNGANGANGDINSKATSSQRQDWYTHVNEKPRTDPAQWEYWGRDIAQHQIHYSYTDVTHTGQGTNGTAGGNGGQGGAGGVGGNPGTAEIDDSGWVQPNQNRQTGATGANGATGQAGTGGTHGQHCVGHFWTGVTVWDDVWRGHQALPPRGHKDRVFVAPGHAGGRGSAANGVQPQANAFNAANQQAAAAQPALDKATTTQAYKAVYEAQAKVGTASPFVKLFPGL